VSYTNFQLLQKYNDLQSEIIKSIALSEKHTIYEQRVLLIVFSFLQGTIKYSTELKGFKFNKEDIRQLIEMKNYLCFVSFAGEGTIELIDRILVEIALGIDETATIYQVNDIFSRSLSNFDGNRLLPHFLRAMELLLDDLKT